MKFFLALVLALLLSVKWTSGQTGSESIRQFGIVGNGVMGGFYKIPDGFDKEVGFGWTGGLYYTRGTQKVCFMSELLFAKRSFLFSQNFDNPTASYNFKGELDVTHLLLNIHFLIAPQISPTLTLLAGGGPYFGYGLSANRKQTETLSSGGGAQSTYTESNLGFGEN